MMEKRTLNTDGSIARLDNAVWEAYPLPALAHPVRIHYIERFRGLRRRLEATAHSYWEFIGVLEGSGELSQPERPPEALKPDTIFLVPPGAAHREEGEGRVDLLWVGFDIDFAAARRPAELCAVTSARLTRELLRLWETATGHYGRTGLELEGGLLGLVGAFLRRHAEHAAQGRLRLSGAIEYLNRHPEENVPVAQLAELCRVSKSHFSREFRRLTGISPGEYHLRQQVRQAMTYLRETDLPAARIAGLCGFASPGYFSRCFRKRVGMTPGEYRKSAD